MTSQTDDVRSLANCAGKPHVQLPCPYDVALALAVIRTKPPELTVREYIVSLLPHYTGQKRWPKHFDRASYWRAEHERANNALNTIVEERDILKRENEMLKLGSPDSSFRRVKRRKAGADEAASTVPQSACNETDESRASRLVVSPLLFACDLDKESGSAGFGSTGDLMMSSLFQLHMQTHEAKSFNATTFAYHLSRMASNVPKLSEQAQQHCHTPPLDSIDTKNLLWLLHRVIVTLVHGINKLDSESQAGEYLGQTIHAYGQMVSDLLNQTPKTSPRDTEPSRSRRKVRSTSRAGSNAGFAQSKRTSVNEMTANDIASRCLCSILSLLDPKVDVHMDLFEAFAFVIIERLGDRLFTLNFGHRRGSSIEEESMKSHDLESADAGAANISDTTRRFREDINFTEAESDAPYLIHLLRHLVAVSTLFMGSGKRAKSDATQAIPATSRRISKGLLADVARERFQRTLINCTFGAEGINGDDPLMQCLKPLPQLPPLTLPRVQQAEVNEWFIEEVWKLIGWDILTEQSEGESEDVSASP